jgi:hypothetical protein
MYTQRCIFSVSLHFSTPNQTLFYEGAVCLFSRKDKDCFRERTKTVFEKEQSLYECAVYCLFVFSKHLRQTLMKVTCSIIFVFKKTTKTNFFDGAFKKTTNFHRLWRSPGTWGKPTSQLKMYRCCPCRGSNSDHYTRDTVSI